MRVRARVCLASVGLAMAAASASTLYAQAATSAGSAPPISGVGLVVTEQDQHVEIAGLLNGAPAQIDGTLRAGDVIVAVKTDDGHGWLTLDQTPLPRAVGLIRGPEDSEVGLRIARPGERGTIEVFLSREILQIPPSH